MAWINAISRVAEESDKMLWKYSLATELANNWTTNRRDGCRNFSVIPSIRTFSLLSLPVRDTLKGVLNT